MSEVKRYAPWDSDRGMVEHQFGNWVDADDYDALHAENERLERERAEQWNLRRDREAERDTNAAVIEELRDQLAALRQPVADEREVFEAWADQQWPGAKRQQLERDEYGQYTNSIYRYFWIGWQARAALSAPVAEQDVSALVEALKDARFAMQFSVSCQAQMVDRCRCSFCVYPRIDAALAAQSEQEGSQ